MCASAEIAALCRALSALVVLTGCAAAADLAQLGLEELMEIEVTTVSRKEEKAFEAAAAVFALTGEDLRRAGVSSVPEALRLVPGLQVAQIDASKWAVSARGFNGQFANKLLVLIDGRSVYTPLFSGVFWDVQDLLLEDVERIEVIRGPGASLWGANAVNGIVNIITRPAAQTQGSLLTLGGGRAARQQVAAARGGRLGGFHYRVYAKYFQRGAQIDSARARARDDWHMQRGGLRLDRRRGADEWMFQTAAYAGRTGQTFLDAPVSLTPPYRRTFSTRTELSGYHLLGRWTRRFSARSVADLQLYFDHTRRRDPFDMREQRSTWDLDFQHRMEIEFEQELVWGLGYRAMRDRIEPTFFLHLDPERRTDHLLSFFLHDEIALSPDRLRLALGAKLERNAYTGFEFQPNARLLWTPDPRRVLWAAASRAVRTPARGEHGQSIVVDVLPPDSLGPGAPTTRIAIEGNAPLQAETLLALEVGSRTRAGERFYLDATAFLHDYEDLVSYAFARPYLEAASSPPQAVLPLVLNNAMQGRSLGLEVAADGHPRPYWRLRATYAFLVVDLENPNPRLAIDAERRTPRHHFGAWSSLDLPRGLEADLVLRRAGSVRHYRVPAYLGLDLRLGWRGPCGLQVDLGGRDLLDSDHPEFGSDFGNSLPTRVERRLYARLARHF